VIAIIGIAIAYRVWIVKPGTSTKLRERFALPYTLFANKWYFDELIDFAVVRPAQWGGRCADSVLERVVIAGGVTGSVTGLVRAGSAAVRRAQTGFVRYYAALVVVGLSGLVLYFLITST
jgi:NADH-quinone oxidoreductase subunit L